MTFQPDKFSGMYHVLKLYCGILAHLLTFVAHLSGEGFMSAAVLVLLGVEVRRGTLPAEARG